MITFDPWYTNAEYLKILEALDYNDVDYHEYIDLRTKQWFLDLDDAPTHKHMTCSNDRYLVMKTQNLKDVDDARWRRIAGSDIERFITNDAISELQRFATAWAFLGSLTDCQKLSENGRVWFFGRYNESCLGVMVERPEVAPSLRRSVMVPCVPGNFDLVLRKELLDYRGFIRKYDEQPYFENGKFYSYRGYRPQEF